MPGDSFNIILFGETGVGKSSIINLIAGRQVAAISSDSDVQGCTLSSKEFSFEVHNKAFKIWDTVGLEEPQMGVNGFAEAVQSAFELIKRVSAEGLDLLLFCICASRITATTQSNYNLFYDAFCGRKVPIALVITHLEREACMENWWSRNSESLEKYGLRFAVHACVTGLNAHTRYDESRQAMRNLLGGFDEHGRYNMISDIPGAEGIFGFLARFVHRLVQAVGLSWKDSLTGKKKLEGMELEKFLSQRCRFDAETAHKLAKAIGCINFQ